MTYPCNSCNRDEGSPVCLGDNRCQRTDGASLKTPRPTGGVGSAPYVEVYCYWPSGRRLHREFDHWPSRDELPVDAVRFDIAWPVTHIPHKCAHGATCQATSTAQAA